MYLASDGAFQFSQLYVIFWLDFWPCTVRRKYQTFYVLYMIRAKWSALKVGPFRPALPDWTAC